MIHPAEDSKTLINRSRKESGPC